MEDLTIAAKMVTSKHEAVGICSQAYDRCNDNGESFSLEFPGFTISISKSNYSVEQGKPELVLTGGEIETHYTPNNRDKAIEFLNRRIL